MVYLGFARSLSAEWGQRLRGRLSERRNEGPSLWGVWPGALASGWLPGVGPWRDAGATPGAGVLGGHWTGVLTLPGAWSVPPYCPPGGLGAGWRAYLSSSCGREDGPATPSVPDPPGGSVCFLLLAPGVSLGGTRWQACTLSF